MNVENADTVCQHDDNIRFMMTVYSLINSVFLTFNRQKSVFAVPDSLES